MKKKVSLILIFTLLLILLTGCKKDEDIIRDVKPYRIMNRNDRSVMDAARVEFAVYVEDPNVDIHTLEEYVKEIVELYKNKYKGILISFYEYEEETALFRNIPFAVGAWAPLGDFPESITYTYYTEDDYEIAVKKNNLVYTPTEEDVELYLQYLRNDRDLLKVFEERNISDDLEKMMEIENRVYLIENRYEEVVER